MRRTSRRPVLRLVAASAVAIGAVALAGCVRFSGGTWMIRSASTPQGWPPLTPVGVVEVKDYPTYRAAIVDDEALADARTSTMFMELFRHIQENDISMTAPVEMGYGDDPSGAAPGEPAMQTMAFLYRMPDLGSVGEDGAVRVRDLDARTYASVGVRGDYTDVNFVEGLELLEAWLESSSDAWTAIGPPRYLGYNGPLVPTFLRYGEVQIEVRRPTGG